MKTDHAVARQPGCEKEWRGRRKLYVGKIRRELDDYRMIGVSIFATNAIDHSVSHSTIGCGTVAAKVLVRTGESLTYVYS